jgi:hypothetical protein
MEFVLVEEVFKDLQEVWRWGKQAVRKLDSSKATTAMNMMMYRLTELVCWNVPTINVPSDFCHTYQS